MKSRKILATVLTIALIITALCLYRCPVQEKAIAQEKSIADKEFIRGFEAGVRYGLIVFMSNPTERDVPTITKEAKKWYYLIVVDEGKTLIDGVNKGTEIKRIKQ